MQISTALTGLPEPRRGDRARQISPERNLTFRRKKTAIRALKCFSSSAPNLRACHKLTCPRKSLFKNADDIPLITMEFIKMSPGSSC